MQDVPLHALGSGVTVPDDEGLHDVDMVVDDLLRLSIVSGEDEVAHCPEDILQLGVAGLAHDRLMEGPVGADELLLIAEVGGCLHGLEGVLDLPHNRWRSSPSSVCCGGHLKHQPDLEDLDEVTHRGREHCCALVLVDADHSEPRQLEQGFPDRGSRGADQVAQVRGGVGLSGDQLSRGDRLADVVHGLVRERTTPGHLFHTTIIAKP